jgi:hypothetical protein
VRDKVAQWFVNRPDAKPGLTTATFRSQLDTLADDTQLTQSAAILAKNRPLFNATITGKIFTVPYNP